MRTNFVTSVKRHLSTSIQLKHRKVAVLGAAGGIGQPLSLLLKSDQAARIKNLALYDIANMGMAADLAHIPTATKVKGFSGEAELGACLKDADVVFIPAGVPRKPGMTRDDLFNVNATIVSKLATACAEHCPAANLLVISNPVNSTVPIAYETMRSKGVSNPKVFGVTTLDIIRAKTFIGELRDVNPAEIAIDVVGGHSGPTIVPFLSSTKPTCTFTDDEAKALVQRIQYGGDEVVKAKAGTGSATLSMAFAAKEFYDNFIAILDGQTPRDPLIAFVKSDQFETGYFATRIDLHSDGQLRSVAKPQASSLSAYENELLSAAIKELAKDIQKGLQFAKQSPQ